MKIVNNIRIPTALEQFLIDPSLQERYGTYDSYINATVDAVKHSWNSGSIGALEQKKDYRAGHGPSTPIETPYSKVFTEKIVLSDRDAELFLEHINNPPPPNQKLLDLAIKFKDKYATENKYAGIKIKKLKYYKRKELKNANFISTVCPYCFSTLKPNIVGALECTKDRLAEWENKFLQYNKMNDAEKTKFILTYEDSSVFFELFEKWSVVEEAGKRPLFDCGYTNRLFNPISKFRTTLPDPILIRCIERSLGSELTEQEKLGEVDIFRFGKAYFRDFKKGRIKVKIPQIVFPTDLL